MSRGQLLHPGSSNEWLIPHVLTNGPYSTHMCASETQKKPAPARYYELGYSRHGGRFSGKHAPIADGPESAENNGSRGRERPRIPCSSLWHRKAPIVPTAVRFHIRSKSGHAADAGGESPRAFVDCSACDQHAGLHRRGVYGSPGPIPAGRGPLGECEGGGAARGFISEAS